MNDLSGHEAAIASTPGRDAPGLRPASASPPPSVSVVVPCYDERENIAPLADAIGRALAGRSWELIIVDDDSPDGTADEARRLGQIDARIRCLRRVGRRGLSSAVIEGALAAAAPLVAVIDGPSRRRPA